MNWGTRLFLTLGVFAVGMVFVGIYMVTQNTDSLEYEDYYERGIQYDEVYNRRHNVRTYKATPTLSLVNDSLIVQFRYPENAGSVFFKRASDKNQDTRVTFYVEGDRYGIPTRDLSMGAWEVTVEWESINQTFEYREDIFLK